MLGHKGQREEMEVMTHGVKGQACTYTYKKHATIWNKEQVIFNDENS